MIRNSKFAKISSRILLAIFYIVVTMAVIASVSNYSKDIKLLEGPCFTYVLIRLGISLVLFSVNVILMSLVSQGPFELVPSKYKKILRLLIYIITILMLLSWGLFLAINTAGFLESNLNNFDTMKVLFEAMIISIIAGISVNVLQFSISLPVRKNNEIK